jgi:hypothetical protein
MFSDPTVLFHNSSVYSLPEDNYFRHEWERIKAIKRLRCL